MNKKLILASTGAAVIAAAGFGSVALAGDDTSPPASAPQQDTEAPTGELDAVPETAPAEGEAVFDSEGGTVLARCTDDGAELVWWVAAEGYTVEDVEAVPERDDDGRDDDAEIEFEGGAGDVDIEVHCVGGVPQADVDIDDDDGDDDRDDDDDLDDDDDDDRDDD